MSVFTFDKVELDKMASVYDKIATVLSDQGAPSIIDFGRALQAAHYANTGAYCMTYGETMEIGPVEFDLDGYKDCTNPTSESLNTLVEDIDNLLYNCVTNAGTDFMPLSYADTFAAVKASILDYLSIYYGQYNSSLDIAS